MNSISALPLAVSSLILLTVALVASLVPALKTIRFDPNQALHGE